MGDADEMTCKRIGGQGAHNDGSMRGSIRVASFWPKRFDFHTANEEGSIILHRCLVSCWQPSMLLQREQFDRRQERQ